MGLLSSADGKGADCHLTGGEGRGWTRVTASDSPTPPTMRERGGGGVFKSRWFSLFTPHALFLYEGVDGRPAIKDTTVEVTAYYKKKASVSSLIRFQQ